MAKPPHILHLGTARSWRGGEQQIVYLIEELLKLGGSQSLLAVRHSPLALYAEKKDWMVYTAPKKTSLPLQMAAKLARICRQEQIEGVHAHDSHAHTAAILAAEFFGMALPIVVSRRVDFPVGSSWFSRFKYNHPQVKRIICVSEIIQSVMQNCLKQPARLSVVHSGVDLNKFPRQGAGKLRGEYQIPLETPLVGNVAALADHKDYPTFVDTVALLKERGAHAAYFIIGDGPERAQIEAYVRTKDLQEDIIFTGFRKDIEVLLPELDLLLFTSKMEGLGTTLLDAQAAGVPILATRAGGIPEIIEDGKNGKLAPVGDAAFLADLAEELLTNKTLRKQLAEQAQAQVGLYSKEKMAEKMLLQYQEIIRP